MKKLLFLFMLLLGSTLASARQDKGITPMHQFLQANADSTLIMQYKTGWMRAPYYLLLSKKGDTVTSYTYREVQKPTAAIPGIPKTIADAISKNSGQKITSVPVDINRFFTAYPLSTDLVKKFWNEVSLLNPWSAKDDKADGAGCPSQTVKIYDGSEITLYLITKQRIKVLSFYAPDFYEAQCPGRPGRITINKMSALFRLYLK